MPRLTDCLNMPIVVDLDVKPLKNKQTKRKKQTIIIFSPFYETVHVRSELITHAKSEASGEPVHSHCLSRTFAVRNHNV